MTGPIDPRLRAGDSDRDAVAEQLREAHTEGRLTLEELEDRLGKTYAARTFADLAPLIEFGASPRAAIFLLRAAKAHAFIRGRAYVTPDDIKALGLDVLRHRVILTYRADAEGVGPDALLTRIFEAVPVP